MPNDDKPKGDKPVLIARARQRAGDDFMMNIGGAWPWKNGNGGYVVKLHSLPVAWNGEFILSPPKKDE